MTEAITVKVTPKGMVVPYSLIRAWGDVEEVEIARRADAVIIKPKANHATRLPGRIVNEMKAAGLVEDLPWSQPPAVSPEQRACLAEKLSHGPPLSEMILEDREDRA